MAEGRHPLMARTETKTMLDADIWASSSDGAENRQNPEDVGIVRTVGYDLKYQQEGSGLYPSSHGHQPAIPRVGARPTPQADDVHS